MADVSGPKRVKRSDGVQIVLSATTPCGSCGQQPLPPAARCLSLIMRTHETARLRLASSSDMGGVGVHLVALYIGKHGVTLIIH
jgi:hypothetical protein